MKLVIFAEMKQAASKGNYEKCGRPPLPPGQRKRNLRIYLPGKVIDAVGGDDAAKLIATQSVINAAKIHEQEAMT